MALPILHIDGSILEGGGQILRNATSLSALLSKPIRITQIRHGREPPGLKNQHRTGLELAARIASAQLVGTKNGSTEITFIPGNLDSTLPGYFEADSVTAGAITLLLQISLPLLLFSPAKEPSSLLLKGGTNAAMAPQVDYTQHIFLPFARKHFGLNVQLDIRKRGYYPRGGGEAYITVNPISDKLSAFSLLRRGSVLGVKGISHFGGLPSRIGSLMVEGATQKLKEAGYGDIHIDIDDSIVNGSGSGIVLWAELEGGGIIGGSAVGRKGVDSKLLGEQAAIDLMKGLDADGAVDEWLQDQIILFMALADGQSKVLCGKGDLTLHTKTAIFIAEQLTDARFEVEEADTGHRVIRCKGIGFTQSKTI